MYCQSKFPFAFAVLQSSHTCREYNFPVVNKVLGAAGHNILRNILFGLTVQNKFAGWANLIVALYLALSYVPSHFSLRCTLETLLVRVAGAI